MNAIQFIKDHGVDKAREVVEGAPEGSTHFVGSTYLKLIGAVWWNAWLPEWSHKDNCMVKKWKCESIELMKTWGEVYKLEDLKRLVESVDLVNNCGGLAIANKITFQKRLRNEKATHFIQHPENKKLIQLFGRNQCKPKEAIKFDLFEQAIADYESVYGGEHV